MSLPLVKDESSRNKKFLLASVFIDNIGNGIHTLVMGKILYDVTGSVLAFGAAIILEHIFSIVLQVVAGAAVDRGDPRRITVYTDIVRGFALIVASLALSSPGRMVAIWISLVAINAGKPFARSASFALIPEALSGSDLGRFYSLFSAFFQAGQLLGIALAGPLLVWGGSEAALFVDGATYLVSAALILALSIKIPKDHARAPGKLTSLFGHLRSDWLELVTLLRQDVAFLINLVLTCGDFLVISFINVALAPLVAQRLGQNPKWFTILDGTFAVAAMLASLGTRFWPKTTRVAILVLTGEALCLSILAWARNPSILVATYGALGVLNATSLSFFMASLQYRCVGPIKGRISGLRYLVLSCFSALLIPFISWLHTLSLMSGLLGSGLLIALFAIGAWIAQKFLGAHKPLILSAALSDH